MKIDTHLHSFPFSKCSTIENRDIGKSFSKAKLDLAILTNHYPNDVENYHPNIYVRSYEQRISMAKNFLSNYERVKIFSSANNVNVLMGMELRLMNDPYLTEILLYGLTEKLLLENHDLYYMSLEQLRDFTLKNNILAIQSHPFRSEFGVVPIHKDFIDGIEVINGGKYYDPKIETTLSHAIKNNFLVTAGSDAHYTSQAGTVYMETDEKITNMTEFIELVKSQKATLVSKIYNVKISNNILTNLS